jgi:hypothetical protein
MHGAFKDAISTDGVPGKCAVAAVTTYTAHVIDHNNIMMDALQECTPTKDLLARLEAA